MATTRNRWACNALAAVALGAAVPATAGVILSPTAVMSNTGRDYGVPWKSANMINHSGLTTNFTSGVTDFATYIASNPKHAEDAGKAWLSRPSSGGITINFDLGAVYDISKLVLWNAHQASGTDSPSVKAFNVYTSNDATFAVLTNVGSFVNSGPASDLSNPGFLPAVFDLADTTGRYVQFHISSNYGNYLKSIGEIAFDVSAVPEPATWSMMLIGFGLCGGTLRHRRRGHHAGTTEGAV